MKELPKISIITPSFQQGEFLEETINSVLDQHYPNLEYIIIDGGSTDNSVELIEKYKAHLSYWVSEPDKGQSHAINKGLMKSTGAVFNWLNSDDTLASGALEKVGRAFLNTPELVCFGGMIHHFDAKGPKLFNALNDVNDTFQLYGDPVINQMATFYNADLVRNTGVDTALHYAMDYDLWLNILFSEGPDKMQFEPLHLANFRVHTAQKTDMGAAPFLNDISNILVGLLLKVEENELADILRCVHPKVQGYTSSIPIEKGQEELVRNMAVYFMLKWHHNVYSSDELRMMKRFVEWMEREKVFVREAQKERLEELKNNVKAPNWLAYRLRRKMKHLGL